MSGPVDRGGTKGAVLDGDTPRKQGREKEAKEPIKKGGGTVRFDPAALDFPFPRLLHDHLAPEFHLIGQIDIGEAELFLGVVIDDEDFVHAG